MVPHLLGVSLRASGRRQFCHKFRISAEFTKPLVTSGLISIFKKIWADSWGPRMEYHQYRCGRRLWEMPAR